MTNLIMGYPSIGNGQSIAPFNEIFQEKQDISIKGMKGIHALILWGGTDIHPSLYNEASHTNNEASLIISERDLFEWKAIKYCVANQISIIGVCRGAQMLCAYAGGRLYQDVTGHNYGRHSITTSDDESIMANSAHHQMMCLDKTEHVLLAWSSKKESSFYHLGIAPEKEPEIVFFPTLKALAIQGHPEWMLGSEYSAYCLELVRKYLLEKVEVAQ
jgi:GMP synthase-like glutamine amidotransferase